jgi:hypothetical protein
MGRSTARYKSVPQPSDHNKYVPIVKGEKEILRERRRFQPGLGSDCDGPLETPGQQAG